MSADRAIRWSTVAAVAGVAMVAGWVSYLHAEAVVSAHGEVGGLARLYPLTIDGLIYAASMVLLDAARRDVPAPRLARYLLAAGIGATLAANLLAGLAYGPLGAVAAAWPALALVGSYELLMLLVRGHARSSTAVDGGIAAPGLASVDAAEPRTNAASTAQTQPDAHVAEQAEATFAGYLAAGQVPSLRRIQAEMHVGRPNARLLRVHLEQLIDAGQVPS